MSGLNWLHGIIKVQERFEVDIKELPEQIDTSTYSKYFMPGLNWLHGIIICPYVFVLMWFTVPS
jgi:hypothetical protein